MYKIGDRWSIAKDTDILRDFLAVRKISQEIGFKCSSYGVLCFNRKNAKVLGYRESFRCGFKIGSINSKVKRFEPHEFSSLYKRCSTLNFKIVSERSIYKHDYLFQRGGYKLCYGGRFKIGQGNTIVKYFKSNRFTSLHKFKLSSCAITCIDTNRAWGNGDRFYYKCAFKMSNTNITKLTNTYHLGHKAWDEQLFRISSTRSSMYFGRTGRAKYVINATKSIRCGFKLTINKIVEYRRLRERFYDTLGRAIHSDNRFKLMNLNKLT